MWLTVTEKNKTHNWEHRETKAGKKDKIEENHTTRFEKKIAILIPKLIP